MSRSSHLCILTSGTYGSTSRLPGKHWLNELMHTQALGMRSCLYLATSFLRATLQWLDS